MLIVILEYLLVEDRFGLVSENVEIASKGDQVCFELGYDILPQAPGANAIASAVMAVPVLVLHDVI